MSEASRYELGVGRDGKLTTQLTDDAFDEVLRSRYRVFEADLNAVIGDRAIQIPPRAIQPEQGEQ